MTAVAIPLSSIDVGGRLRALDPAWVDLLAEEIAIDGLIEPVRVVVRGAGYKLVDGARRIAAHLQLGWDEIEAQIEAEGSLADDAAVRLAEIKGHLLRGELTALDHAVTVAAWCDIYRGAHGTPKRGRKKAAATDESLGEMSISLILNWSEAAQKALRIGRATVFRSLKIAGIPALLRARIALAPIAEHPTELLALANETEVRQAAVVDLLLADPVQAGNVAEAVALLDGVARPAPLHPYERFAQRFADLPPAEQHRFFDLQARAIDEWLARRRSGRIA